MARTVADLFLAAAETDPKTVALRTPRADDWHELPYGQLAAAVREIAGGLVALGIQPHDRVALLAETRAEWTLVDGGIACAGAVAVPIYPTSSPEQCRHVLRDSGARAIVCEDAAQVARIARVRGDCPRLTRIVVIDGGAAGAIDLDDVRRRGATVDAAGSAAGAIGLDDLRRRGAAVDAAGSAAGAIDLDDLRRRGAAVDAAVIDRRRSQIDPDDPATIVYTSGTTGPSKGCVLTHANWVATVDMYLTALALREAPLVVVFLFLPLAHALTRVAQLTALALGGTIAYWRGDPARLLDDIAEAGPTHLPVVPRVLEKLRARVLDAVDRAAPSERRLFTAALAVGGRAAARRRAGVVPWAPLWAANAIADRLVLARIRAPFGDRLEQLLLGAAPIDPDVLRFFAACGIEVLEGYGLTETCAAATLNRPGAARLGTVGPALPGVELRIAAGDEVLVRGPNVFPGYWRDETVLRTAFTRDGWLRTGDRGVLEPDGALRITGRLKELIVTSGGKNVAPSPIEAALREIRWVSQAVVFGDGRPYIVAALTLDADELPALAERVGGDGDAAALAAHPRVRALLAQEVDAVNARFARVEQVKRFQVLPRDLELSAGELTPTMKVRREIVYSRYRDVFAGLYDAG